MEESFFLKLLFNMRWLPGKWIKDRKSQKEERKKKKKGIERGRVFFLKNYYLIYGGFQESEWRWYMFQKKKRKEKEKSKKMKERH